MDQFSASQKVQFHLTIGPITLPIAWSKPIAPSSWPTFSFGTCLVSAACIVGEAIPKGKNEESANVQFTYRVRNRTKELGGFPETAGCLEPQNKSERKMRYMHIRWQPTPNSCDCSTDKELSSVFRERVAQES
jgi:hypothetical protein